MRAALAEANAALAHDDVPVGAVVVRDGEIIAARHNERELTGDPTAHAEVLALRSAGAWTKNYRMTGATLYVTLEPCLMCFGALIHARVGRVVFGASDPKVGVSRWLETLDQAALNHRFTLEGGLLEPECRAQIQAFFRRRR